MQHLYNLPCGTSLPPNNPHAVSVNLPTMASIIGYEEGDDLIIDAMESGYPRFFTNRLVRQLTEYVRKKNVVANNQILLPITSLRAKEILENLLGILLPFMEEDGSVFLVFEKQNDSQIKACQAYIRNIGLIISSRKAEATLSKFNQISKIFFEAKSNAETAAADIKATLAAAYDVSPAEIILTNSGMNAVFAASETIMRSGRKQNRLTIVQLGWLYLDTTEIIEKRSAVCHLQINVGDKYQLEQWLSENHLHTAMLVTEAITNPLLHCIDLPWLYSLCQKYGICLIVDSTIATPYNAVIMPYCDIAVESLTKFASGGGDVMMGAIIFNKRSKWFDDFKDCLNFVVPPFEGEINRMAFQIINYESRVKQVAKNTYTLYQYLIKQPYIKQIYSVFNASDALAYTEIRKTEDSIPGLLTVVFDQKLELYYDRLEMPKGPTLGTEFTIAMPYVYLAHYHLLQSDAGRMTLKKIGLHPELLRISVGIEPIEEIIYVFEKLKLNVLSSPI